MWTPTRPGLMIASSPRLLAWSHVDDWHWMHMPLGARWKHSAVWNTPSSMLLECRSLIIQGQRRSPSLKRVRAVEPLLPSGWLCLVVLLNSLDCISSEDNIPSLAFSDPWQEISEAWRVGAFVDDTNQGEIDSTGHLGLLDLVKQLCHAGQT